MNNVPYVSIIIPTYNRDNMLAITLDSFVNQSYPKNKYEIIVSNNNSKDNTQDVIDRYVDSNDNIVTINETRQGVHFARNSAAKIAKGEILYFTDDDMIADCNLLTEIVNVFQTDNSVACATGKVLPKWEVPPPEWVLQLCQNGLLSLSDQGEKIFVSENDPDVFSCHQAVKREVFFAAGGFNPENTAGEWLGDGETGLNIKIKELGYKFAYNGKSVIHHMIPKTRMTQQYLNKRLANQGNCDSYTLYRKNNYKKYRLFMNIFRSIFLLVINVISLSCKFVKRKSSWRISMAEFFYCKNRILYDFKLIYSKEWRLLVKKNDWLNDL